MTALDAKPAATLGLLIRLPKSAGLLLGVLPLPLHALLPMEASVQLAALLVTMIAGVYLGFAFRDENALSLMIELAGASLFLIAAYTGLNGFPVAILLALLAHGLWDIAHYHLIKTGVPGWYIPLCALYDWGAAIGLSLIWYGL